MKQDLKCLTVYIRKPDFAVVKELADSEERTISAQIRHMVQAQIRDLAGDAQDGR